MKSGEFEKYQEGGQRVKLTGLKRDGEHVLCYRISELNSVATPKNEKMVILGSGSVIGDYEIINHSKYTQTLSCLS